MHLYTCPDNAKEYKSIEMCSFACVYVRLCVVLLLIFLEVLFGHLLFRSANAALRGGLFDHKIFPNSSQQTSFLQSISERSQFNAVKPFNVSKTEAYKT